MPCGVFILIATTEFKRSTYEYYPKLEVVPAHNICTPAL